MKAAWVMWLGRSRLLSGKQAGRPRKTGVAALAQKQHEVVAEEAGQAKRKGSVTTGGASDLMMCMTLASQ